MSLSMVSLNIVVLLSDVSRRLKTGWQEHTSKLFSCSLYVRRLFECDGCSKALGTGRLLLARKTAKDSLISAWLYGVRAARRELDGWCVDLDSDIVGTESEEARTLLSNVGESCKYDR